MAAESVHRRPHFLIVTYPLQSHINPALNLAHRLSSRALVTFSTAESAHRRMFSGSDRGGNITFLPYPDVKFTPDLKPESDAVAGFASVIDSLAARGPRVTCVIYTILLTWAADAASDRNVPSVQFWIQPATAFASYYHYFHGHSALINTHGKDPRFPIKLPGLPPMEMRDLPSFITTADAGADGGPSYSMILPRFREGFEKIDREGPKPARILVNTLAELEPDAFESVPGLDLIPIGPVLPARPEFDLFEPDEKKYLEWLDGKPEKSVAYVSFGSISVLKKVQVEEILRGLRGSGRPFLWVVRRDSRHEGVELEGGDENAMVVEWCSQVRVLGHPSVGCFVTHCGWNSTTESLVHGVPTVAVPQWSDQGTNAMLMEKVWGTGVRGEVDGDGVLEGGELRRCLDLVMGEGERGREIRKSAGAWRAKVWEAVSEGGSSDRNLRAFIEGIHENYKQDCHQ